MARDKEHEWRMQGIMYALDIARSGGVEALEADVKKRGLTKAPLNIKTKEVDNFVETISRNVYNNMLATFSYSLHELYGFGGERLKKLQEYVYKIVQDSMTLDYMGEHYVRLEDFAIEMNQKYNLDIDVSVVASCQDVQDEKEENMYHFAKIERIIEELMDKGYIDAAEYLKKRMED